MLLSHRWLLCFFPSFFCFWCATGVYFCSDFPLSTLPFQLYSNHSPPFTTQLLAVEISTFPQSLLQPHCLISASASTCSPISMHLQSAHCQIVFAFMPALHTCSCPGIDLNCLWPFVSGPVTLPAFCPSLPLALWLLLNSDSCLKVRILTQLWHELLFSQCGTGNEFAVFSREPQSFIIIHWASRETFDWFLLPHDVCLEHRHP